MNRAHDWLDQARHDLEHARKSKDMGDYNWACFAAQQAAGKAIKAVHLRFGQVARGSSPSQLLEALPEVELPTEVLDAARVLDKHYITPRYPDVYPAGAAYRKYIKAEADEAVRLAEKILVFCESHLYSCNSLDRLPGTK
ncbi:MAG: HEPN domain-containing protein [Bacillota bacterium]|nr:HEPN domain-containing protein [Bacillota bacterium]MDI7249225.1 HEPN domain-containing protein [Bacillota bacterium]